MLVMEKIENHLLKILIEQKQQIVNDWVDLIFQLPGSNYQSLLRENVRRSCLQGIEALIQLQECGSETGIDQYVHQISLKRLEQGFNIREVIQALLLLHRAVLLAANQCLEGDPKKVSQVCLDLDDSLRIMVSQFGSLYSTAINRSLEEQQQQANSLARENERLYQETQRRLEESMSMQRVTSALLQGRTLNEVLSVVCNNALSLIGAKGSTVFLLEDGDSLRVAYSLGYGEPAFDAMPVNESFAGSVIKTGEAVFTNRPRLEPVWYGKTTDENATGGVQSLLASPLIVRGKIIGALVVIDKAQPFNQDDLRVMGLFADQAAIAIENSRLTQDVERIAVMEERNRLDAALRQARQQQAHFRAVLASKKEPPRI